MVLVGLAVYFLWRVEDTLFLKQELRIAVILGIPLFVFWAVVAFTNFLSSDYSLSALIILIVLAHTLSVIVPLILSYRVAPSTLYREVFGNDNSSSRRTLSLQPQGKRDVLSVVMENPILAASFEKFCAKSFCIERSLFVCFYFYLCLFSNTPKPD